MSTLNLSTDPRIAKQPQWVQDIIFTQARQLEEARLKIAELNEGPEDSNVSVADYAHGDRKLGKDARIVFTMPDGEIVVHHDRQRPGCLELRALRHGLAIQPSSGNVVRVKLDEF